jgi:hypothetical protein
MPSKMHSLVVTMLPDHPGFLQFTNSTPGFYSLTACQFYSEVYNNHLSPKSRFQSVFEVTIEGKYVLCFS